MHCLLLLNFRTIRRAIIDNKTCDNYHIDYFKGIFVGRVQTERKPVIIFLVICCNSFFMQNTNTCIGFSQWRGF